MDENEDPSLQFFSDGNVDLYSVLDVKPEATQDEIKKAYRKLALRLHPDKILNSASTSSSTSTSTSSSDLTPTQLFQRLSFSYSILSDKKKRKRYDETGKTSEPSFGSEDFDWNEYFKTLWTGEVSGNRLKEFKLEYQNSSEERADITEAYLKHKGSLNLILSEIPCSEILTDENRIIEIIENLIQDSDLPRLENWTKSLKDDKGRENMRGKAKKEAEEAEEMAKEMGVWEELFGDGTKNQKKKGGKKVGKEEAEIGSDDGHDDDDEEEEEEDEEEESRPKKKSKISNLNGKSEPTSKTKITKKGSKKESKSSTSTSTSSKSKFQSKKKSSAVEEDPSLSGLASIIASRQKQRAGDMNGLIERLEKEAADAESKNGKGKGKGKMSGKGKRKSN